MNKQIVFRKTDDNVVDGVIVNQAPVKVLHYIIKTLDLFLLISFFAVTRWLLKETNISPMFGLCVFLVRFLWYGIDIKLRKSLGIELPRR